MYEPFERQGSVPQATHAKLDKTVIEQNDVTIQFLEGYLDAEGSFIPLGAEHINLTPAEFALEVDAKTALQNKLAAIDSPAIESEI